MTAELSRRASDLGVEQITTLAGPGRLQVNDEALRRFAEDYTLQAMGVDMEDTTVDLPKEVVNQVRAALLERAPLDLR